MLEKIRALNEIAAQRGQTLAQMALAWTLRDPRVTSTLIGASSVAQLEANVGALEQPRLHAGRAGRDRSPRDRQRHQPLGRIERRVSAPRLQTPLCDLLGIREPILLAGMANGPGTAELVAAVTRAGGLGVFGASGMTCEALERELARARELAPGGPIGVNAQLALPTPATGERERILAVMRPFRRELGLPDEPPEPAKADPPAALIECALAAGAASSRRSTTRRRWWTRRARPARACWRW